MPVRFTVCSPAFSLIVTFDSALSVGGWFTGLTVTVNVFVTVLLLVPPSLTVTVMSPSRWRWHRRERQCPGRVRACVVDRRIRNQPRIAGNGGDRQRLDLVGRPGADAGQIHRLQPGVLVDRHVRSAFSVGGWFTGLTVTVNVFVTVLLLVPPSLTVTVIVAVPLAVAPA